MSFFGELKCLQVWGTFPLILNFDLKISPEFPRGFSFHLQPKFPRGFPPPTTKIPADSPRNPRDFARWEDKCSKDMGGSFNAVFGFLADSIEYSCFGRARTNEVRRNNILSALNTIINIFHLKLLLKMVYYLALI